MNTSLGLLSLRGASVLCVMSPYNLITVPDFLPFLVPWLSPASRFCSSPRLVSPVFPCPPAWILLVSVPVLSSLCCFYMQSRSMSLSLSWTCYLPPIRTLSVVFSFMEINSLLFLHPRMCLLLSPADNTVMTLCDITKEQFSSAFRLHSVKHFFTTTFHYRCNNTLIFTHLQRLVNNMYIIFIYFFISL